MKSLLLFFFISGFTFARSTPITKNIEQKSASESIQDDSHSQILSVKNDIKVKESKTKPLRLEGSKSEKNNRVNKEEAKLKDESKLKNELKLENFSDPKLLERTKKACQTVNSPIAEPTKVCFDLTPGAQSSIEICHEDKQPPGLNPQIYQGPRPVSQTYQEQQPLPQINQQPQQVPEIYYETPIPQTVYNVPQPIYQPPSVYQVPYPQTIYQIQPQQEIDCQELLLPPYPQTFTNNYQSLPTSYCQTLPVNYPQTLPSFSYSRSPLNFDYEIVDPGFQTVQRLNDFTSGDSRAVFQGSLGGLGGGLGGTSLNLFPQGGLGGSSINVFPQSGLGGSPFGVLSQGGLGGISHGQGILGGLPHGGLFNGGLFNGGLLHGSTGFRPGGFSILSQGQIPNTKIESGDQGVDVQIANILPGVQKSPESGSRAVLVKNNWEQGSGPSGNIVTLRTSEPFSSVSKLLIADSFH